MPLLDHFHAPLYPQRHWEAFHSRWASSIADALNEKLTPDEYFAEPETHASGRIEIDVATFDERHDEPGSGGTAVATLPVRVWAPPAPALQMPAVFPGAFQIKIFRNEGGAVLVGAIELVSPANKDRAEERRAFAAKCANYLYHGVSLVIVDVVTSRRANLHNELVRLMERDQSYCRGDDESLYAIGYRPVRRKESDLIEIWPAELAVGAALPTLPLFLKRDLCLPIDLEATHTETCRRLRLVRV